MVRTECTPKGYEMSSHAKDKIRKCNITESEIDFVLERGITHEADAGRTAYKIPDSPFLKLNKDSRYTKLKEIVVVLAVDKQTVATVYIADARCPFSIED